MKRLLLLTLLILFTNSEAWAANTYFNGYNFEAYVSSNSYPRSRIYETWEGSRRTIRVKEGQQYSIVVKNPLPVRVAVAVSVDGLNIVDGKQSRSANGRKWIIEPYSQITLRGWQTSDSSIRKFVFTRPEHSYATWKERQDWRDYSKNLGVIGIAYFWNSRDLAHAVRPWPMPFAEDLERGARSYEKHSDHFGTYRRRDEKAGTGMGRREHHPVYAVNFTYDTGMYSSRDALRIYYKFGRTYYHPEPFVEDYPRHYRYPGNYAPEMP